jgi:predicted nucleotidyltransferase
MERNEIIRTLRGFVEMNRDRYEIIRIGVFGSAARDSMNELSKAILTLLLSLANRTYLILLASSKTWKNNFPNLWMLSVTGKK